MLRWTDQYFLLRHPRRVTNILPAAILNKKSSLRGGNVRLHECKRSRTERERQNHRRKYQELGRVWEILDAAEEQSRKLTCVFFFFTGAANTFERHYG